MLLAHGNTDCVRFRATWRNGEGYHRGDVVARGVRSYQAIVKHTAGTQSEPGHGDRWHDFWEVYDPEASLHPVRQQQLAVVQSLPLAPAPPAAPPTAPVAVPLAMSPAPAAEPARRSVPGSIPDRPPLASEVIDDSGDDGEGAMSVAFALDALRAHLRALAQQLALVGGAPAGSTEDPLTAELWARKRQVLGAASREECQAMMAAAMWDWLRLIRKQGRGEVWTADEVARNAILEAVDQRFLELDRAYERMRADPPLDLADDRHWRRR